ncbi:uncharacterized protein J4E78_010147 [Alternaria triticimaculans]|uniref:uncharacterized protein n=1 Tax=Alternaria triticimaculans TaxID=297637 RepID=UPI0020C57002|nr:uncharacterized protein J4E78_010147 [Alternaria triticimaculans]KAI4642674.1 hypothetical protein J4E78_010147 [Alternaria triticimaculans]
MSSSSSPMPQSQKGFNTNNEEPSTADPNKHEGGMKQAGASTEVRVKTDPLEIFVDSMRECEHGHHFHMICRDGVMRVIEYLPGPPDQVTRTNIFDAKPMSPELIKSWLDRGPWSQEKEDRFRGVDGRTVPQEQWLNPPVGLIPTFGTKNERDEEMRKHREERAELERKIASGEVEREPAIACMAIQSNYDLSPR